MDIYGCDYSSTLPISILSFSLDAKRMPALEGQRRDLTRNDDYPKELRQLCAELSVENENAQRVSDQFQLRFARNEVASRGLLHRDRIADWLGLDAKRETPKIHLAALSKLLRDALDSPNEQPPPGNRKLVRSTDPYVRMWFTEGCLGPRISNEVRLVPFAVADDPKEHKINRLLAMALLCETGWPPRDNEQFVRVAKALQPEAPEVVKAIQQLGIDWELVVARS